MPPHRQPAGRPLPPVHFVSLDANPTLAAEQDAWLARAAAGGAAVDARRHPRLGVRAWHLHALSLYERVPWVTTKEASRQWFRVSLVCAGLWVRVRV